MSASATQGGHKNESKHSEMDPVKQNPIQRTVRSVHVCALHCAQLLHTILHRTDLIISPLTLQTIIIAPMMSIWGKGAGQIRDEPSKELNLQLRETVNQRETSHWSSVTSTELCTRWHWNTGTQSIIISTLYTHPHAKWRSYFYAPCKLIELQLNAQWDKKFVALETFFQADHST